MRIDWGSGTEISIDGAPAASVQRGFWGEKATIQLGDVIWEFGTEGMKVLVAYGHGQQSMHARSVSSWRMHWQIETSPGQVLDLRPAGVFTQAFNLEYGGQVVARIEPKAWSSRPSMEVPDGLTVPQAIFVMWVCYVLTKRSAATIVATSS